LWRRLRAPFGWLPLLLLKLLVPGIRRSLLLLRRLRLTTPLGLPLLLLASLPLSLWLLSVVRAALRASDACRQHKNNKSR
jgi:hypothetical protein